MTLLDNYASALEAIYDHIGFKEDWAVFPIDDSTDKPWYVEEGEVHFFDTELDYINDDGNHSYSNEVLRHRFYKESVYKGPDFTGILVDTHTDGNKFLQIFSNHLQIKR